MIFWRSFSASPPITRKTDETVLSYFWEVYRNATGNNSGKLFRIRGNLELIIAYLVEQDPEAVKEESQHPLADLTLSGIRERISRTTLIKRDPRIQAVVDYLVAHPTEHYNTERLSDMAQMSPSTLRRLFKEHTGKSPGEFISDLRMVTAARLLLISNERISAVAYELGYSDQNYFNRLFKKTFGVSPGRYRKQSRE